MAPPRELKNIAIAFPVGMSFELRTTWIAMNGTIGHGQETVLYKILADLTLNTPTSSETTDKLVSYPFSNRRGYSEGVD